MSILVLNCGSSSLKAALVDAPSPGGEMEARTRSRVHVERVGGGAVLHLSGADAPAVSREVIAPDHAAAVQATLAALDAHDPAWREGLRAVGHRVVHGGSRFREPALIDDEVSAYLESLSEIAPLHNAAALAAVARSRALLGAEVPAIAVFDTAFHRTMPDRAARYAIPHELTERHEVYRYGFHGLAHRFMTEQFARVEAHGREDRGTRLITLQLGQGCSVAAVHNGQSIDTSMGFTPLEGLVMGTRSGDLDPAVLAFLARREDVSITEVERWLNTRSGLLGVSGSSGDVRDLLQREADGDDRAALALEMFCYRAKKYVGAYMAALGGADGIVFGGGIGEHAPSIRARICEDMAWAGLQIDRHRNAAPAADGRISTDDSRIRAYVFPVDEEQLIARETVAFLETRGATSPD